MIHRKESAAEIAMRIRLGISPHRPFVWLESIDGKRAEGIEARKGGDAEQGSTRSAKARCEASAQPLSPENSQ